MRIDMENKVKEIQDRLIAAEAEDGHLSRRDCWTLFYEIFSLRRAIEKIYKYSSIEDTLELYVFVKDIMKGWQNEN
jgi:hypothetical protein